MNKILLYDIYKYNDYKVHTIYSNLIEIFISTYKYINLYHSNIVIIMIYNPLYKNSIFYHKLNNLMTYITIYL